MSPESAGKGTAALRDGGPCARALSAPAPLLDRPDVAASSLPALPVAEVFTAMGSTPRGLTPAEAAERPARYGPDELPSLSHSHVWRRMVKHDPTLTL
ncbi:cation-transporting P-type ATPase [Streptomyces sp. NPDC086182]|uniref:cation-transporting P-type ATPase n=1 Tax=Streptomyces sp. NPDC086182 TaxID=3155058 RepID=UPI00341545F3